MSMAFKLDTLYFLYRRFAARISEYVEGCECALVVATGKSGELLTDRRRLTVMKRKAERDREKKKSKGGKRERKVIEKL